MEVKDTEVKVTAPFADRAKIKTRGRRTLAHVCYSLPCFAASLNKKKINQIVTWKQELMCQYKF